jgi:hypothetical protein
MSTPKFWTTYFRKTLDFYKNPLLTMSTSKFWSAYFRKTLDFYKNPLLTMSTSKFWTTYFRKTLDFYKNPLLTMSTSKFWSAYFRKTLDFYKIHYWQCPRQNFRLHILEKRSASTKISLLKIRSTSKFWTAYENLDTTKSNKPILKKHNSSWKFETRQGQSCPKLSTAYLLKVFSRSNIKYRQEELCPKFCSA